MWEQEAGTWKGCENLKKGKQYSGLLLKLNQCVDASSSVMHDLPYSSPVHYMIGWERECVCCRQLLRITFIFALSPTFWPNLRVIIICREGDCLLFAIRGEAEGGGAREWPSGKATNGAVFSFFFDAISFFSFNLSCPPRPWQGYKWCSRLLFSSFLSYTKLKMATITFPFSSIPSLQ